MFTSRIHSFALFLLVFLLFADSSAGRAQSGTGSVSFGAVAIGQTSPSQSVTLTFSGGGTTATELALTQGADKQDFATVSGGSCATGQSYQAGATCTALVTFTPQHAGLRMGAVELLDASGALLAGTYISGVGSGPQVGFQLPTVAASGFPYLGITADKGIAIDGNSNIFLASYNSSTATESVVEVPAGCAANACVKQLPGSFYGIWGLAVDGAGNVWVGDVGASGTITEILAAGGYASTKLYHGSFGNQIGVAVDGAGNIYFTGSTAGSAYSVVELLAAGGYSTVKTLAAGYNSLEGITVDALGNVFFTDTVDKTLDEIVAVNGSIPVSPTIRTLASGLKSVQSVAVDSSGDLFVTTAGTSGAGIYEWLVTGGYANSILVSNGFNAPTGIAVTAGGDLFIIDSNQAGGSVLFKIGRATTPGIAFPTPTAPGETDTADGPQRVTLQNLGNQPLSLATLTFSNANFSLDSGTTTCDASITLAAGDNCDLGILFHPTSTGANITGALSLTDNSGNAAGAKQSLPLSGAGLFTPAINLKISSSIIAVSQPLTLSIAVNGGSGNAVPTGTVQVNAPGYTAPAAVLVGGAASVTIPPGTLSPGALTLAIAYIPDTASSIVYTPATTQLSVTVTSTILNAPTVTVTPAVGFLSIGQALSVTVAVSQASGSPVPTGTISLAGANYTSPATTLSSGTTTITIPPNSLVLGTDELVATYTPDSASTTIYVPAAGAALVAVNAASTAPAASPVDFGSIDIGKTSAAHAIPITFPADATPATFLVTTLGATGKDFASLPGGTCGAGISVAAGQSCTVSVAFTPAFAGLRSGAVIALDANGQQLAFTYLHGSGSGAQLSVQADFYSSYNGISAPNYPYSFSTLADGFSHPNVAIDGAGNVFVADLGIGAVREIPAGCTSASCVKMIVQAFYGPSALAVDGAGNIFVAEVGNNDVKKIPPGCTSYSCIETVGTGFNQPYGLSVDADGNIFVADTFNNAIKEVVAAGGYTTIKTLASGLDLPWSVVVNAGGDLFVAEGGDQCTTYLPGECSYINTSLLEITAASGYSTIQTISSGGFGKPFGLAIDGSGNVFEADYGDACATEFTAGSAYATGRRLCESGSFNAIFPEGLAVDGADNLYLDDVIRGKVYKMDYANLPSINFRTATLEGVADVDDGLQVVSVQNNGTAPLTISSLSLSNSSFKLESSVTTCSTSTPIAVGASCYLAVSFSPTVTGPIAATLTLTDNNLNQNSTTQLIQITAVALPPTPSILTTPANPTTATTATFTFSDTQTPITFVCSIDSLPFAACASPATYTALSGGAHAFQVKAKDTVGNLSLAAIYNWVEDSVGPPAPAITSAPAYFTNADTAAFAFTDARAGVTYQCSLDGVAFTTCASGISYSGMAPPATVYIQTARHSFAVKAVDASSNFSPETTFSWTTYNQVFSATPVDFGPLPVGQTSSPQSVTFNPTYDELQVAGPIATIDATTLGVTGLDFTVTDPGTCTVGTTLAKGTTCTLKATFTPKYPGQRKGAVVLLDSKGNGIGEAYLQGTGTAPQVTFGPYSTVTYNILPPQNNADPGKDLVAPVTDVTLDGAGNIYASDLFIASVDGSVSVSTGDIWKFPVGCNGPTCSTLAASGAGTTLASFLPNSLTMDGAGVLWANDPALFVSNLPTVGTWYPTQCSYLANFPSFMDVAADGSGNIAMVGNGLLQSCFYGLGVGQKSQTTSFDFSTNTPSLTIDPAGNFFVADTGNNAIKEVLASSGYTIDRTVGSGFSSPYGVTSDAFGNIYVADTGNNAVKEIVASSGYTQVLTVATFDPKVVTPEKLTVDAQGNIYIATSAYNTSSVYSTLAQPFVKLDFADAPALNFSTSTKIGTTDSTDGTLVATVRNNGNQPLTFSGLAITANFSIDSDTTTCSTSAPLASGATCTVGVFFTPNAPGALTGTLTLTDNALNLTGATQQFALSGTAFSTPATATPTVIVAPGSANITTAQSDAVTITVSGASGSPTATGGVSLIVGAYTSATVPLVTGSATINLPAGVMALGTDTVNAVYSPDTASSTTYGPGAGSAKITVSAVPATTPTVSVIPAAIDISVQQSLSVLIAVTGGSGNPTPTGTVTLSGGNYASLASTLTNGSTALTIPAGYLPSGNQTLTAYYTPDPISQANYTSASGSGLVAVEAAAKSTPTVSVTPSSPTILANQPLQVTVQLPAAVGHSAPTGSIVLSSGAYASTAFSLSMGRVTLTIPAGTLAIGSDTLTATYSPDSASLLTYASASGAAAVTVNSPRVATSTSLHASASSVAYGTSVTFTVGVTPASGTGTPSGSVSLMDGASTLATLTLDSSGAATYSTSTLAAGIHSLTAVYQGDANDTASTSATVSVTVAQALLATTTTLQASASSVVAGTSLTFTANVSQILLSAVHLAPNALAPTGTVTFLDGTASLGTAILNSSGIATFSTATLVAGTHSLTATYSGDAGDTASTSAPITVTVAAAVQTASLTPSSLSFTALSGVTSAAQVVTLSNTGNIALGITGISITGTDPSAFAQSTTCGVSLAPASSCTISLTFSPTSAASFAAILSVADNATGSPQTVTLSGTGTAAPNFTLSASPAAQTVPAGTVATYTLTISPQNGAFNHAVSLSVTGLPQGATATFAPASVNPGSSAATSQLSIQTVSTTAARSQPSIWPIGGPALALIGLFFLPGKRRRQWLALGVLFLAALGALTLSGCGGGFALNTPSAKIYSITVSATSSQDVQTTTVQLTVK